MRFNPKRLYTPFNADELQVGSICCFGDSFDSLATKIEAGVTLPLRKVEDEHTTYRFVTDSGRFYLAYLIEAPSFTSFKNLDEAFNAIKEHGFWVKSKKGYLKSSVTEVNDKYLYVRDVYYSFEEFFKKFEFLDGSPCGKKGDK